MVISKSGKEANVLHTEKRVLRVEKPTILQQCSKNSRESKKKCSQKFKRKKVNQLDDNAESSYSSEKEILSVSLDHTANAVDMSKFKNKTFAHMEIANELVKMQVDSGASCNVLPRKFLPRDTKIKKTNLKLTTYSKTNLRVLGVAKYPCETQRTRRSIVLNPLLGSSAAQQMGLITVQRENILQVRESYQELNMERITASYPDVFQGLGCMEGALHLEVDESASPSIMPPRRVPLTLKERLKEELARLEKANMIKREEEPADWVSSLVVTEKTKWPIKSVHRSTAS